MVGLGGVARSAAVNSRAGGHTNFGLIQVAAGRWLLLRGSYWSMSLRRYGLQDLAWSRQMDERSIHSSTACTGGRVLQCTTQQTENNTCVQRNGGKGACQRHQECRSKERAGRRSPHLGPKVESDRRSRRACRCEPEGRVRAKKATKSCDD